jgi:hypothetical protein
MATTSGQEVLLPDSSRKQRKSLKITVEVNSIDRSRISSYFTNNFRWDFRRPLKDITSIELVSGSIPADLYNVTTEWNTFVFGEASSTTQILSLTPGQYTQTTLASELERVLNTYGGSNTYTVSYSDITKKITITGSSTNFTFFFRSGQLHTDQVNSTTGAIESINCPAVLFGFDRANTTSASNVLVPPYRVDTNYCIKRLYLYVNADNSKELSRVELGSGRKDCFHVLYLSDTSNNYYNLTWDTYMPIYYSTPAPISRMSSLTISIRDEFFRLVDLGNHEYSLVFEITTLE